MRKTLGVAALMLAFCCPTLAGEIPNPPAPTPPQSASAIQEPTGGETLNGEMSTPPGVLESLTQTVLELLAVLPSLL
jgi:hypothetical protein